MVDNFKLIRNYLKFYDKNTFYFCQLIKRKKDNPNMDRNNEVIHSYYIYSLHDLDDLEPIIKKTCEEENCRAYIHLNDLDLEKVALNALAMTARLIRDGEYKKIIRAWSSACGETNCSRDKVWLLDLDGDEVNMKDELIEFIDTLEPLPAEEDPIKTKFRLAVPTAHGLHLMVKQFNIKDFSKKYNTDEFLHKDNPTILYIP